MLDFPGRTACIVWFTGCNMRCGYCHNPQIVKGKGRGEAVQVLDFLKKRQGLLEGVVLSGGEATLYPGVIKFAQAAKAMGYAVKLDTNGTRPDVVIRLIENGLVDFIALDYKAPGNKFKAVTGIRDFEAFARTLDYLCRGTLPFEVRTTVHTALLDEQDIAAIMSDLSARGYGGIYYIQNYINNGGPTLGNLAPPPRAFDRALLPTDGGYEVAFRNF